jgi:hypothetical protein
MANPRNTAARPSRSASGYTGQTAYGRMNGIYFNATIDYNGNCTIRAYVKARKR